MHTPHRLDAPVSDIQTHSAPILPRWGTRSEEHRERWEVVPVLSAACVCVCAALKRFEFGIVLVLRVWTILKLIRK